ncbi:unnamed protein product [Cutaneotrichosporon oleaginosum]
MGWEGYDELEDESDYLDGTLGLDMFSGHRRNQSPYDCGGSYEEEDEYSEDDYEEDEQDEEEIGTPHLPSHRMSPYIELHGRNSHWRTREASRSPIIGYNSLQLSDVPAPPTSSLHCLRTDDNLDDDDDEGPLAHHLCGNFDRWPSYSFAGPSRTSSSEGMNTDHDDDLENSVRGDLPEDCDILFDGYTESDCERSSLSDDMEDRGSRFGDELDEGYTGEPRCERNDGGDRATGVASVDDNGDRYGLGLDDYLQDRHEDTLHQRSLFPAHQPEHYKLGLTSQVSSDLGSLSDAEAASSPCVEDHDAEAELLLPRDGDKTDTDVGAIGSPAQSPALSIAQPRYNCHRGGPLQEVLLSADDLDPVPQHEYLDDDGDSILSLGFGENLDESGTGLHEYGDGDYGLGVEGKRSLKTIECDDMYWHAEDGHSSQRGGYSRGEVHPPHRVEDDPPLSDKRQAASGYTSGAGLDNDLEDGYELDDDNDPWEYREYEDGELSDIEDSDAEGLVANRSVQNTPPPLSAHPQHRAYYECSEHLALLDDDIDDLDDLEY